MPVSARGKTPSARPPPPLNYEDSSQVYKKQRMPGNMPPNQRSPLADREASVSNENAVVRSEEIKSMQAAVRFLRFCNEAWSDIQSSSPVQEGTSRDIDANDTAQRQRRPLAVQTSSESKKKAGEATAIMESSPRKNPATPPGFKVSSRVPKPGEPPLWGVFAESSQPLKSPIRLRLRNRRGAIEASIGLALGIAQQECVKFRATSEPVRSLIAANDGEVVPPPCRPPKGGTLMYIVKQNNKLKGLQRGQRRHPAPQKGLVRLPTLQTSTNTDWKMGAGAAAVRMTVERHNSATEPSRVV
jgi:hypothetical protein